ncbi:MAG: phenylalanine--tRNA ligase subunit alpha [Candidatus Korobacteraceae bacterium]
MYSVPKLEDYSPEALDTASRALLEALEQESAAVQDEAECKALRDRWMARKNGILTQINDVWLKAAPSASKRQAGQQVNQLKKQVEGMVEVARKRLLFREMPATEIDGEMVGKPLVEIPVEALDSWLATQKLAAERIDVTLPGVHRELGVRHPVLRTMDEIVAVFVAMGYSVAEGPEIDSDYYNFEALNFPPDHPARDTQDTLFIAGQERRPQRDRLLLRTHTSPVQIRTMERLRPPVRVICPGKVHRNDAPDATHSPVFHQLEGLCVDTNITLADLKGTLDHAMKAMFGSSVKTSFRPSFFPFTEPSLEVSISCPFCGEKGCSKCKGSGWIELLGSGMVDPAVFGFVDYDPAKYSGFAFGMGIERMTMLRHNIDDIQQFFLGDVRFLEQFS